MNAAHIPWTDLDEAALIQAITLHMPNKRIAQRLGRSLYSVDSRIHELRSTGRLTAGRRHNSAFARQRNQQTPAALLGALRLIAELLPDGIRVVLTRMPDAPAGIDITTYRSES